MQFLRIVPCVALAALLVSCAEQQTQLTDPIDSPLFAKGGNSGPSASGQAMLALENLGGRQNVSFHARQHKDGTVSGSFECKTRGQDIEVHGKIDCLVIDGDEAILGGALTQVRIGPDAPDIFTFEVGSRFWFRVRDNGEGERSSPDEFTDWYPDFPQWDDPVTICEPYPYASTPEWTPAFGPIENGNIQVKQ